VRCSCVGCINPPIPAAKPGSRTRDKLLWKGLSTQSGPDDKKEIPMNWYISALKRYAVFSGRARRKEYWYFILFNSLITLGLIGVDHGITKFVTGNNALGLFSGLFVLATFLPALGALVRRLHDTNRSGWYVLMNLIPLIGPIIILVYAVQDSEPGTNEYGPNPKEVVTEAMADGTALQSN